MVSSFLFLSKKFDILNFARYLLIAQVIALMVSPPLTNLLEFVLYVIVIISARLRQQILFALKQPLPSMAFILFTGIGIGVLYSVDTIENSIGYWVSARRLLLILFACALFDTSEWKIKAFWAFSVASAVAVVLSYASFFFEFNVYKYDIGIVIRNYATQSMLFSVAAFSAVVMLATKVIYHRIQYWILIILALLLVSNVVFFTPGRSGYIVLVVLAVVGIWYLSEERIKYVLLAVVLVSIVGLISLSPVASGRITQAIEEAINYQQGDSLTAVGLRVAMLKNSWVIIKENPVVGVGTGGFRKAYAEVVSQDSSWRGEVTDDPHNQFVKILAEYGIIGLFVFVLYIASFFRQEVFLEWKSLGVGVVLAWSATSLFSSHFSTFSEGRFLALWGGIMLAMPRSDANIGGSA